MAKAGRATPSSSAAVRWKAGDDVLTSVLRSLHLQGSVFCRAVLTAPWGLEFKPQEFAHFHVLEKGNAWLRLKGETRADPLREGDLAVIPHGSGHVLSDAPATRPVPLGSLVKPLVPGPNNQFRLGGGGETTRLVCGAFRFGPSARHPLLAVLPPAVLVRGRNGRPAVWLEPILGFLGDEARRNQPGAETVISSLAEVIFVQAVRAWMEAQPETESGWLGALRDSQVGRSLALIHSHPEAEWSVATLAASVGMSRSRFAARFTALLGEGPFSYLRKMRLRLAGELLVHEPLSIAEVASQVGYESEAALSRAFRREWGVSPAAYRRREASR